MLTGKRVRLRAIEREDLPRFVVWLNDPEIRDNLSFVSPLSLGQEEKWYQTILNQPVQEQPLAIEVDTPSGWVPVGNISFANMDSHDRSAEVGIFIGEKTFWDQGYGREAMQIMLRHGFEDVNLNRIYLRVYETNARAIRAYEHAGFVREGCMRQARFAHGRYIDVILMSVIRSEWSGL